MNRDRHPSGQTLLEILLSIFIFALLTTLVIANFSSAQKETQLHIFTNNLIQLFQRAHTNALTNRIADNGTCQGGGSTCTSSLDCGGAVCTKVVPPGGWGIHFSAPVAGPTVFQIYGDRQDAECSCFGQVPIYQSLQCLPNPNKRFDAYGGETSFCNWACGGVTIKLQDPMTCLTTPAGSADFIDTNLSGLVTIPVGLYATVKRADGITATQYADFNFDLTTGKSNMGVYFGTENRDPTHILGVNCVGAARCYDSKPLLGTVCTSISPTGPFERILIYSSGLVVFAGGGNPSC
jgi:type II secretory pathway pseudopilin PulG